MLDLCSNIWSTFSGVLVLVGFLGKAIVVEVELMCLSGTNSNCILLPMGSDNDYGLGLSIEDFHELMEALNCQLVSTKERHWTTSVGDEGTGHHIVLFIDNWMNILIEIIIK